MPGNNLVQVNYLHFQSSSSTYKYYNAAYIERSCFTCNVDRWRLERKYGILELQTVLIDSLIHRFNNSFAGDGSKHFPDGVGR